MSSVRPRCWYMVGVCRYYKVRDQTLLSPLCSRNQQDSETKIFFASRATCTLGNKVTLSSGVLMAALVHLGPPQFQSLRHRDPYVSLQLCLSKSPWTFLSRGEASPCSAELPHTLPAPRMGHPSNSTHTLPTWISTRFFLGRYP